MIIPTMDTLIIDTLGKILASLSIPFDAITTKADGNVMRVDIASSQASRLIGWHGETLNALQHVLKSVLRTLQHLEKGPYILVDVDGYRQMQEDKVKKIAEQKAEFVRRTHSRVTLSPMSPYFRRVVHMHVASTPTLSDITTESMGEGEYRQVVMRLKDESASPELSPVMAAEEKFAAPTGDGLENLDI